jgi:hypothetical protein
MTIDSHTHILPPDIIKKKGQYLKKDATFEALFSSKNSVMATAETLIDELDQSRISSAVVLGMGWQDTGLNSYVNDYILESASQNPFRLYPFTGINPASGKAGIKEAERCANLGSHGFGEIHPSFQKFDLSDKSIMETYMSILESKNLPITIHCSEPVGHNYPGKGNVGLKTIENFVLGFPENKIILGHWGGGLPFYELMPEIKLAFKNVYYDSAASPFLYSPNVFSIMAQLVGTKKMLFGSDYPVINQNRVLTQLENSSLSESQKLAVQHTNMKKLISVSNEK